MNEENLYKAQLEKIHKTGNRLKAISYREDIEENEEMQEEIKAALLKNMEKKKKLLNEGKPEMDFSYTRLL